MEVARFINDIIIRMEKKKKKKHNEVVEEVVKKLADNDLYVKLKKYKWKIKEVEFLKIVIRLEEINMEKEKVKMVLD